MFRPDPAADSFSTVAMNIPRYMQSLTQELMSTKNRVRDFIDDAHWLTDGEWKESVLRNILRRHLPKTYEVGRGFVICGAQASKQIDILIYRTDTPVLFRDGDLVFLTPDAVVGIIEVKSALNGTQAAAAIDVLAKQVRLIRCKGRYSFFSSLFSYDASASDDMLLSAAKDAAQGDSNVALSFASLGESSFLRFWTEDPEHPQLPVRRWHSYRLDHMAPGYFLHNIIERISPRSVSLNPLSWFPENSKEAYKTGQEELS